jgi:hypothetical protein
MTTDQVIRRQKAITRRFAWKNIQPEQHLQGVNKCQGLKPGQHPVKLAEIIVLDSQWEPLNEIIKRPFRKAKSAREWAAFKKCCGIQRDYSMIPCISETALEGFPFMTPEDFVEMLLRSNRKATEETPVNRIVFEYAEAV